MIQESFSDRVVRLAKSIPEGRVTTYGSLARAAGAGPMAARSITGILGTARSGGVADIPFHRIVYADGRVWVNEKYAKGRMKLYEKEGIEIDTKGRIINFQDVLI
jgi:methylated-DNA-protein-cysteine methyltransferase-like protein